MKGNDFEIKDNWNGTITKTLDSGEEFVYNILARGNVPAEDSIVDYWYFQHDTHKENLEDPNETSLVEALKAEKVGEWSFCSGTCTAMVLAITYGDKSITPKSVLYWGDDSDDKTREVNWTWATDENGNYIYEDGKRKDMGLKAWEQDKYENKDKQVYDNTGKGENGGFAAIDGSDIENDKQYLKNLKTYLAAGQPVIIHVRHSISKEHYVVAVGVEEGVSLEEATYEQLVIFDPGTDKKPCITTIGNAHKDYTIYDHRMLTPYLYDFDQNDFVRDENDGKTTDSYYVDPVKKKDGSIVPSEKGRTIKKIIDSINNSNLPDHKKEQLIEQMIKAFTGEEDVDLENLTVTENGEYEPDEGVPGFKKVVVDVKANVKSKDITANGEYKAVNDNAEGFDKVTVNVPDNSDELEKYKKLWEMKSGGGEPVETDIPKPEDPDNPGEGGNYVFENAVDVGSSDELSKYIPMLKNAKTIDIVEIGGGLAIHLERIYNGNRIDMQLTVTNLKNGMSTFGNSCHYNSLDIRHNGCEYMGIAIHNGMVSAYYKSGYAFILDTWLSAIDFHAPDNWNMYFILV